MKRFTIIAGVNGTGKSSLRGVLEGQAIPLGHIVDADLISKQNHFNIMQVSKQAMGEIRDCLDKNISFTQETTLSGRTIKRTILQAREQGYFISMFYVGLSDCNESLLRIVNRVKKGGHNIPTDDVIRRYENRLVSLNEVINYCNEITFYDNENGFIKVADMFDGELRYTNRYRPQWIVEIQSTITKKGTKNHQ